MRIPARFRDTTPAVVALLALVLGSCGGDTTSPTSVTMAAPTSTDGLVTPGAENCERLAEVELEQVTAISADLVTSGAVVDGGGLRGAPRAG